MAWERYKMNTWYSCTLQCFVQLVSQLLNLLRCSDMKGGVTLGNVLCKLSCNVDHKKLGDTVKFRANTNELETWSCQRWKLRDKLQMGMLHCVTLKKVAEIVAECRTRFYFLQRLQWTCLSMVLVVVRYFTLCSGSCNLSRNELHSLTPPLPA